MNLGSFLCSIGLHATEEDPRYAFLECRRCGKIWDFAYPPGWRGFMKPPRPESEPEKVPVNPLPAARETSGPEQRGFIIEHFTREKLAP